MSQEVTECLIMWESQPWGFSNSDNSGGSEQNSEKKLQFESRSNSPTIEKAVMAAKESSSKDGGDQPEHEVHIWTERERRKKMRNMFSGLHALLPQLPPKADKSTVVNEAVNYIKSLQQTLQNLQKQKLERMRGASITSNDVPSSSIALPTQGMASTREAFLADQGKNWTSNNAIAMNSSSGTGISFPQLSDYYQTWSSPNVVVNVNGEDAHINICTPKKPGILSTIFYVLDKYKLEVLSAHVSSNYFRSMYMIHAHATGLLSDQFPETLFAEEIFKTAAGEILLLLSS